MEIILKEDIIGLGYKNDIVKVKNGYGRNYLIPTGKGVIASESARKMLAENLRQQAAKLAAKKAEAEKRAEQLKDVEVVVTAKVAATGYLYGSVTGLDIDRKIVTMKDAKKVGEYEATIHFHKEVEVKVPVKVLAENAPEPAAVEAVAEKAPKAEAVEAEVSEEETPAAE